MKPWSVNELNTTDILTFALCMMLDKQGKLKPGTPFYNKLDTACNAIEALRDMCRSNEHYTSGFISIEEAIYHKVRRDKLVENLEGHMQNETNASYRFLLKHNLDAEAVLKDPVMLDHIIALYFRVESENEYWSMLDCVVMHGVEEVLERREPIDCANCGETSDVIFTADDKPCCKRCIENISTKCEICDSETLKGVTEVCDDNGDFKDACFKCLDAYYTYIPNLNDYIHNDSCGITVIG